MTASSAVDGLRQERLIKSPSGWWFVGNRGTARLRPHQVDQDGTIRPGTEQYLRDAGLYEPKTQRSYSLTVLTSTDCNLGCGYCFQNTGQDPTGGSRPPRITHSRLTSQTIGPVMDFTRQRMAEAGLDRLSLLLFGGEPLLNPRGCVETLTRASELGTMSASMTSNGTLLTRTVARQLADAGLSSVQITFDGDQTEHDSIRVTRSGKGTFDAIIANVVRATDETPLRWSFRVNVSHHTADRTDALVDRLAAELDPSRCTIYFAFLGDVGVGYGNELQHTREMADRMTGWQIRALEHGFAVGRPTANSSCVICTVPDGKQGAVVNADGVLYSCWETAGKPGWEVGTVSEGYLPSDRTEGRWASCGDFYQHADSAAARAEFRDRVDAAFLDHLHASGKL
ncbi:radical SAM protein [Kitasatospora sp. MAP5-34]|uniref:radical SAM protein n=1 Tax=Kitasatospora sp. MAP5-34 TaxID=3035102 RepID=UPI00247425A1|nr:radical SAM protein [Kitasatospora sp. MAP5-34]MDH6579918.1 uncharacterized protein [Kitasatospora sp. MAP5-34]